MGMNVSLKDFFLGRVRYMTDTPQVEMHLLPETTLG